MTPNDSPTVRDQVRNHYAEVARKGSSCCGPTCCTPEAASPSANAGDTALRLGYTPQDLEAVPGGANLGLGCGNPQAIAGLRPGETVIDLGSGAGFDCLLAARQVGPTGKVIGIDMTPDMISRARQNAAKAGANVEFRLGEIEHLPVPDRSADVIISNCVINLSPDKAAVFREALRVLRPGGRLAISDVVALGPLPEGIRQDLSMYTGCVAGAATVEQTTGLLTEAGFVGIEVTIDQAASRAMAELTPEHDLSALAASARIEARRPEEGEVR
jgi:arsenite methyltransferase